MLVAFYLLKVENWKCEFKSRLRQRTIYYLPVRISSPKPQFFQPTSPVTDNPPLPENDYCRGVISIFTGNSSLYLRYAVTDKGSITYRWQFKKSESSGYQDKKTFQYVNDRFELTLKLIATTSVLTEHIINMLRVNFFLFFL